MLKNVPPGFRKALVPMLMTLAFATGCTKAYEPGDLVNDRIDLLTGQPDSVNWKLSTILVNNTVDVAARGTVKVYRPDGTFTDNLGFVGFWSFSGRDSLIESSRPSVNPNAPFTTNRFRVDFLDKGNLQLTCIDSDNKKIRFVYDANR